MPKANNTAPSVPGTGLMPSALRRASPGSSLVNRKNSTAVIASPIAQKRATPCQPYATITIGASSLVTAEPMLPAPKMPSAVPCFSCGNHLDT